MNILLSINNMGLGGVTTYMAHLAKGLAKKHNVVIFDHYPYSSDYQSVHWVLDSVKIESVQNCRIIDYLVWKWNSLFKIFHSSKNYWIVWRNIYLKHIVKKHKIDVIISFDKFSDNIIVDVIGKKIPLILSIHGSYDISEFYAIPQNEIVRYEKVFRTASAIVYKSDCNIEILNQYRNLTNLQVVKKILHGFDANQPLIDRLNIRKLASIPENALVIGMIARGVPEKGWKEAIGAFEKLQKEYPLIHFLAIGKSEYLDTLKSDYKKNLSIHFVGFVANNIDWINSIDIGVLPTYAQTENFTFSVVEYLFCGKPSVVSDHGEISTTLDAGNGEKAGILVPLQNGRPDLDGIYSALKRYILDDELYLYHKSLTSKALNKFSRTQAIADYEEILFRVSN
jgi:glycosyltransferase involved in cell wall biosynthesis